VTNVVVLRGRLSRAPGERLLPSGDRLTTFDLTMPAVPGDGRGRADSVGLSWFEAPEWVGGLEAGAELVVVGRVRRRFFQGGRACRAAPRSSSSRPSPPVTRRAPRRSCTGRRRAASSRRRDHARRRSSETALRRR